MKRPIDRAVKGNSRLTFAITLSGKGVTLKAGTLRLAIGAGAAPISPWPASEPAMVKGNVGRASVHRSH